MLIYNLINSVVYHSCFPNLLTLREGVAFLTYVVPD